jgi:hypothetical protein
LETDHGPEAHLTETRKPGASGAFFSTHDTGGFHRRRFDGNIAPFANDKTSEAELLL